MKIIELTEIQFKNYSNIHSSRNYYQTLEYAKYKSEYTPLLLGFLNESNNTLVAATLILTKKINNFYIGLVPGGFLIDYENEDLFKDFTNHLKQYLKEKKFIYITVENKVTYKIYDKKGNTIYFDSNLVKLMDELDYIKINKKPDYEVVLETDVTPNETYKLFDSNTKRNINLSYARSISIYKDEANNLDLLTNVMPKESLSTLKKVINSFNTKDVTAELYIAKLNPEKYINNYRFLLKQEEEKNDKLNAIMQNINIKKSISFINKKMLSDKLITKYNNEIIKATNIYSKYSTDITVGALLIIKNNREIYFIDEGYNKDLKHLYSSHLIKWEVMKAYLTQGYKIFNLSSIDKNTPSNNGPYQFKMGFGSKIYERLGEYDLVINKLLYKTFKIIHNHK